MTVEGVKVTATIDGKAATPDSAGAVAEGTIAFHVTRGSFTITDARVYPLGGKTE